MRAVLTAIAWIVLTVLGLVAILGLNGLVFWLHASAIDWASEFIARRFP